MRLLNRFILSLFFIPLVQATPGSQMIPVNAAEIIHYPATHNWMIDALEIDVNDSLIKLTQHLEEKNYSTLEFVLDDCQQAYSLTREIWCQNLLEGMASTADNHLKQLIDWQLERPNQPHARFLIAALFHQRAQLNKLSIDVFSVSSEYRNQFRVFESIALFELDQVLEEYPGYPYAVALKLEILGQSASRNLTAIEQVVNQAALKNRQSWLIPSTAITTFSPTNGGSYRRMEQFAHFWSLQTQDPKTLDMLDALIAFEKSQDYYLGMTVGINRGKAQRLLKFAYDMGLRTPEVFLLLGEKRPGKDILDHYSAWKYAAFLSRPYSVNNLARIGKLKTTGNTEEGYWYFAQMANLHPSHELPAYLASHSAMMNRNHVAASDKLELLMDLAFFKPETSALAIKYKKDERYEDASISEYLVDSLALNSLYFNYAYEFLNQSQFTSKKGISIGELLMVYPVSKFRQEVASIINVSTLTEDQLILLAKIQNSNNHLIPFPKKSSLAETPELTQQLSGAGKRLTNSLVGLLKTDFIQYMTEKDGMCLDNCRWITSE